jgi:hypothetical protein
MGPANADELVDAEGPGICRARRMSDGVAPGGARAFVTIPVATAAAEQIESGDTNRTTVAVVQAIAVASGVWAWAWTELASWPGRDGAFLSSRPPGHE